MSLTALVDILACPHCGGGLGMNGDHARCPQGHSFDVARQGYLNLLGTAPPQHADSPPMVQARLRFLTAGHYDAIADAVAARLSGARTVVDAGAGPGWYLGRVLAAHQDARGLAIDISSAAIRRAAQAHPRAAAVVADTWAGLPLRPGRTDAVYTAFAPRNLPEFARILRPGGLFVAVTPQDDHLAELRAAAGLLAVEPGKRERLHRDASGWFTPVGHSTLRYHLRLDAQAVADVVAMGPNAFHDAAVPRQPMDVTVSVQLDWFRRPEA